MQKNTLAIALAVVMLVAVPAALGLQDSSGGSGNEIESFPTATQPTETSASSSAGTGTASGETATPPPSFEFSVDNIEECGQTCRDVTTTLTNGGGPATDVSVYTRIYAGNGTDGDIVWEGTETVGRLGAGESYTTTKRVELSVTEGFAVQQNDGWITVRTAITSGEKTVTFTQRRDVL